MGENIVNICRRNFSYSLQRNLLRLSAGFGVALVLFLPLAANASCIPEGSQKPDDILCTGTDTDGVASAGGDDTVTILTNASVDVQGAPPVTSVTTIDTGNGDDTVINFGSVAASLASEINPAITPTSVPVLTIQGHDTWHNLLAIGINLGNGSDYAGNHGSLAVEAILTASAQSQIANLTSSHPDPQPVITEIAALGIVGGNGSDVIENTGNLTVTATDNTGANAASAVGISSGNGRDIITNTGTITVTASSTQPTIIVPQSVDLQTISTTGKPRPQEDTQPVPIATATGIDGGNAQDAVITNTGSLTVKSSTDGGVSQSSAQGILAGNGKDVIFNGNTITVTSEVVQSDSSWTATLTGGDDLIATTTLDASVTGIDSGNGGDIITNDGTVLSQALAELTAVNVELNLVDTSHADTSVFLYSNAMGVISGNAKDTVTNTSSIEAKATSRLDTVNVEINGADAGLADSKNILDSKALALATGGGNDMIASSGSITASATSEMDEVGVNVSYADVTIADRESSDTSSKLYSSAAAIDSGSGSDNIYIDSTGAVGASALSDVHSVGVSIASEGVPAATESLFIDGSLANVGLESYSDSTAIIAGQGNDELFNFGSVTSNATATSSQTGVNVGIALIDFVVPTPGIVLGGGGTSADATATGFDLGQGNDVVSNAGSLDIDASATADSTIVSLNIAEFSIGGIDGFPSLGAAVVAADTTTTASSTALGISAGDGNDVVDNADTVNVTATAHGSATTAAGGLGIQTGEDISIQIDAMLARAETQSIANATGITGDDGHDQLTNSGEMTIYSKAETDALGIGIDIAGTTQAGGAAIGATLTDTSSTSAATATGIDGGDQNDVIVNSDTMDIDAIADTNSINASVTVGFVQKGLVAGAALGRAETEATATATAIDGGDGKNEISNDGTLDVKAKSDADSVAVSVTVGGTTQGLAAGAALADGGATAIANATGIRNGAGNNVDNSADNTPCDQQLQGASVDTAMQCAPQDGKPDKPDPEIVNNNSIIVDAEANTHTTAVSADVQIAKEGAALGAALADNSATAAATSTGIAGNDQDNVIVNNGDIQLKSDAYAQAVSVGVSVQGTSSGLSAGAALTNASVNATASATGVQGGNGDDLVVNTGSILSGNEAEKQVQSEATAVGVSVSSQLVLEAGAALGAALADTDAKAITQLTAIDGEQGNDQLINQGIIDLQNVGANADAISVSVEAAIAPTGLAAGAALANSDSTAELTASGLVGADGKDLLLNETTINLHNMTADADSVSVSLAVTGAEAGVTLSGALVDAQATATTTALGLSGGDDDDRLHNQGDININNITANTDAVGVGVGFSFAGEGVAASAALARSGATSNANATGLDGGAADDKLINDGTITLNNIDADSDAVSVSVGGSGTMAGLALSAGLTDASGKANTTVSGMSGGIGNDYLLNTNTITATDIDSDAHATGISITAQFSAAGVAGGFSLANTSGIANTIVNGLDGGEGDDRLYNLGTIDLDGTATAEALSIALNITAAVGVGGGAAITDASSEAYSTVAGINGGEGLDDVANEGDIDVAANAVTESTAASVGITVAIGGDVTLADAESTAVATAVGIYDPREVLPDDVVSDSQDQTLTVSHHDTGPDKQEQHKDDPPKNLLTNLGNITATATAESEGLAISGNLLGYALGETTNTSTADAAGIRYDQGPALIYNDGTITANSSAQAEGLSVAVTLGGAAVGDTTTTATALASGIESGTGDDEVVVASKPEQESITINVDARSYASGESVAVGLVGVQKANTTNSANATAKGIDSGDGDDTILNDAVMNISAGNPLASDGSANCGAGSDGACAESFGLNFTLAGYGTVDGTSIANANALGISGGEGNDIVQNNQTITITALARSQAESIGITLLGANDSVANTIANAQATGFAGDAGDDRLTNSGALNVISGTETNADSFSLSIAGAASADANATTNAGATGLSGGDGHDKLINESVLNVQATGQSKAASQSVTIFGDASAGADTITNAAGIGIDGGADNDRILNAATGDIDVHVKTQSTANASSWNFAGNASAAATLGALTDSYGLLGGSGDDWIVNAGDLNVGTESWLTAYGGGKNIFGNAEAGAQITANAQATGIDAGAENDIIENSGLINVDAYANMLADTTAASFAGTAATSEFVTAEAHATAIADSAGTINIYNSGEANASVSAEARTQGSASAELAGGTNASGTVAAEVSVAGIDVAEGAGIVVNEGNITAHAAGQAWATHTSEAGVFFSDGGVVAQSNARLYADGIRLGDGDNKVVNSGNIDVQVSTGEGDYGNDGSTEGIFARARAEGGDFDIFTGDGDASGKVTAGGEVYAYGLRLGEGNNRILNEGRITVKSAEDDGVKVTAVSDPNGGAVTIDGDGWGKANTTLTFDATGISIAGGQAKVINDGEIEVSGAPQVSNRVDADGGITGDADGFVDGRINSQTIGVLIGGGIGSIDESFAQTAHTTDSDNIDSYDYAITNRGAIVVSNSARASVSGDANGNGADGDGRIGFGMDITNPNRIPGYARLDAVTAGIELGDSRSWLSQEGMVSLSDDTTSNISAVADSDFTGAANAFALNEVHSDTYALRVRGAESWISNSGAITISATPTASSYANGDADGNGSRAWGTGLATTDVDSRIHGIFAEGANSLVSNTGDITIDVVPTVSASTRAESNLDGDSNSRAKAVADITVTGIETLGMSSMAQQSGDIAITIEANSSASSWSRADGALADTRARADATAVINARGVGVHVAQGTGILHNDGSIEVLTTANTATSTNTEAPGLPKGAENNWSLATADAFGLWAGAAETQLAITNAGTITVDANSEAQVSTVGSTYMHTEERAISHAIGIYAIDEADFTVLNKGTITATASATSNWNDLGLQPIGDAVGIRTGVGNDLIINEGTIDTLRTVNGVTTLGTAIDAGGGNDEVILRDGSITNGDIDLGTGSDILSLEGAPVINGSIIDELSSVTLAFNNSGSFEGELPGYRAVKNGEGTFALSTLPQLNYLAVNKGTLQLNNDYHFHEQGEFQAMVHGDGSHGQFLVNGSATLDGQMRVLRSRGAYTDGSHYQILSVSNGIETGSSFDNIMLPEDRRLLKFELQQLDDGFEVATNVKPFTTVARTGNEMAVARHWDNLVSNVSGDLDYALGDIQVLSTDEEFASALYSLSPAAYDPFAVLSIVSAQQYTNTLNSRMSNLHFSEFVGPQRYSKDEPVMLAANGVAPQGLFIRDDYDYQYGAFVRGFGQHGAQDATAENYAYDFTVSGVIVGIDHKFSGHMIGGASLGFANNDMAADRDSSAGEIDTTLFSLYGSYLFDGAYVDAVVSYGANNYSTRRNVVIGPSSQTVTSSHEGDLLSLGLSGGLYHEWGNWWLRPFVSLQYTHLDEDAFTESGGATSLNVASRKTEALISQLGVSLLRDYKVDSGYITPELSIAWNHDFDIDDHMINASYVGAPDAAFSIEGQPVETEGVILGAGFNYETRSGYITTIKLNSEFRDNYNANSIIGEFRYQF